MEKIDLTQSDVDSYLANTDEFWDTFHKSLKAPFSLWKDHKEKTKKQWAQFVKNNDSSVSILNIIFENAPVLKGEFPVSFAEQTGLILTNYRLFFNGNAGLVIIPLKDLLFYGERIKKGEGWLDEDESKFIIEYTKNGESLSIELFSLMRKEYIENTKNAGEFRELDDVSHSLLSMTFYNFEKKGLNVPKIEFLPDSDDAGDKPPGSFDAAQTIQNVMTSVKTMNLKKWITEIKDSVSQIGKFLSNTNKEELIGTIKNFHHLTLVGVGLILISLIVGWWLMVPIALGSYFLLSQRKNISSGVEKQVSILGTWVIIGLFVLRTLFLMGGGADVPDDQKMFIDEWQRLKKIDDTSGGNKHLKDNRSEIEKWYGEFVKHKSTNSGDIILVKHDGIEYNLSPEIPLEGLDNNVKSIKEGDKVYFTGTLNGERSLTNSGALDEPEMLVKCTKLTNIDMNIVYFEISQEEIIAAKKAAVEAKAAAERRSRMCDLEGCTRDGKGWNYYTESQGSAFGYEQIGCLKKYTTGGYCSKHHCAIGR